MKYDWHLFFSHALNHPNGWMYLRNYDFSKYKVVKTPASCKRADLSFSYGLPRDADFSSCEMLNLSYVNVQDVIMKFNQHVKELILSWTKGWCGVIRCTGMGKVKFNHADLAKVSRLDGSEEIDVSYSDVGSCLLNFKDSMYVNMTGIDVSKATWVLNPNAKKINLTNVKGLSGVLYFGNAEHVLLFGADLSQVSKIICGPNTVLSGVIDSGVKVEYLTSKKLSKCVAGTKSIYRHKAKRQAHLANQNRGRYR